MTTRLLLFAALTTIGFSTASNAGENTLPSDLKPREVAFPAEKMPLDEVLAALQKQTGNAVRDRRSQQTNPTIHVPKGPISFWKTLDLVGREAGIGISPYQPDGGVALVDRLYRPTQTDYSGPFRFAFRRIAVTRDEETQSHRCSVTIEGAWEPRLRLLYLGVEGGKVAYRSPKEGVLLEESLPGQAARSVANAAATDLELTMKAPARTVASLASLTGTVQAIGAPQTLEFSFAKISAGRISEQAGVKVRVVEVKTLPSRWEIDLETEHPKGAILKLQSFQESDWLQLTRVWLAWIDPKTKKSVALEPTSDYASRKSQGIVYRFEGRDEAPLPPPGAEVSFYYRVPSRIVAFTVPFSFRDLPLP